MPVFESIMGMPIPTTHGIGMLLEQIAIVISGDSGEVQRHQSIRSSPRMQAAGQQIAEIDHRVDAMAFEVVEDGVERRNVAVNIGDESDPHIDSVAASALHRNIEFEQLWRSLLQSSALRLCRPPTRPSA